MTTTNLNCYPNPNADKELIERIEFIIKALDKELISSDAAVAIDCLEYACIYKYLTFQFEEKKVTLFDNTIALAPEKLIDFPYSITVRELIKRIIIYARIHNKEILSDHFLKTVKEFL